MIYNLFKLGLIGYPLKHSFSKLYFEKKFYLNQIKNYSYNLFEIYDIKDIKNIYKDKSIIGLNVTIPYKKSVINYLHSLKGDALSINTVNTIKINNGTYIGYNTDTIGFKKSLINFITTNKEVKAIILGTGGSSKAVQFVLKSMAIKYLLVSRYNKQFENVIRYQDINKTIMEEYKLIINTTPLGMYPNISLYPNIPYNYLTKGHFLYDLIYNPNETLFLINGKKMGAKTKNGMEMLSLQADYSWKIWNDIHF